MPDESKTPVRRSADLFVREVPRDIKDKFKGWCATHGLSMKSALVELMRGIPDNTYLKRDAIREIQRRASGE